MSKVRLGLIGCGRIAQTHLEAIAKVPRVQLTAVQDIVRENAVQAASKFSGCEVYSDPQQVFDHPSVDAVLICAPPVTHFDYISRAIHAKKHVICEKPFTMNLEEALQIKDLAARSNRLVTMASKFRFTPDTTAARSLVQQGVIGDVVLAEVIFCSVVDMEGRWNSDAKISGGGVLIDNGSHAVDVIRYVVGPLERVLAQFGRRTQNIQTEDTARLHFETRNGVMGMVDLSWSLFKHARSYVNILGTKGTIEVGWQESILWDAKTRESKTIGKGYNKLESFVNQIEHFSDCILNGTRPIIGIDDAVESVRVIDAAYASLEADRWLEVNQSTVRA